MALTPFCQAHSRVQAGFSCQRAVRMSAPASHLRAAMLAPVAGCRIQPALPARTPLPRSHSFHRLRQSASPRPPAYQDSPDTGDGIQLPEVHKLLQVHEAASRDTCLRAYEKLADTPPEAGYSQVLAGLNSRCLHQADSTMGSAPGAYMQEALYARGLVLTAVAEQVASVSARGHAQAAPQVPSRAFVGA